MMTHGTLDDWKNHLHMAKTGFAAFSTKINPPKRYLAIYLVFTMECLF